MNTRCNFFRHAVATTLAACAIVAAPARPAAANTSPLQLAVDDSQARAVLAILDSLARGDQPAESDWQRLESSAGYRRWSERQQVIGHPVDQHVFREFLRSAGLNAQRDGLHTKASEWSALDARAAGAMAAAYLPAGTPLRATVYPLIKASKNTFVYDLGGSPAIFFSIDLSESAAAFTNTLTHELHHVGVATACDADESDATSTSSARTLKWLSAFSEGRAVLAAAGSPDAHPHEHSPVAAVAQWERDLRQAHEDIPRLQAFFESLMKDSLSDDEATQRGMAFINDSERPQGPFYTVGWLMASTIERELGRNRLIASTCSPEQLLLDYDAAIRQRDDRGENSEALPRWSHDFLIRLQGVARTAN